MRSAGQASSWTSGRAHHASHLLLCSAGFRHPRGARTEPRQAAKGETGLPAREVLEASSRQKWAQHRMSNMTNEARFSEYSTSTFRSSCWPSPRPMSISHGTQSGPVLAPGVRCTSPSLADSCASAPPRKHPCCQHWSICRNVQCCRCQPTMLASIGPTCAWSYRVFVSWERWRDIRRHTNHEDLDCAGRSRGDRSSNLVGCVLQCLRWLCAGITSFVRLRGPTCCP